MKTQNMKGKRRINYKNCYLLFISAVAILSLAGNFCQDIFYNKAIAIQEQTIETMKTDDKEVPNVESDTQQLAANDKED